MFNNSKNIIVISLYAKSPIYNVLTPVLINSYS